MKPKKNPALYTAYECKVVRLRECPLPRRLHLIEKPKQAADYWRTVIVNHPAYSAEIECLAVVMVNTRLRAIGHYVVSMGTIDTLLVHPREVYRIAVMLGAASVVLMHNHPSGDPRPSEADLSATKDLSRCGRLLKVDLLDHVIIGAGRRHVSLRDLGYFDAWWKEPAKPAAPARVVLPTETEMAMARN